MWSQAWRAEDGVCRGQTGQAGRRGEAAEDPCKVHRRGSREQREGRWLGWKNPDTLAGPGVSQTAAFQSIPVPPAAEGMEVCAESLRGHS